MLVALVVAGVAGCATRASVQEIQADVGKVKAELTEVRLSQDLVSADLARVLAELRSLDARAGETGQTLRDTASEIVRLRTRLDAAEDELRQSRPVQASRSGNAVAPLAPVVPAPVIPAPITPAPAARAPVVMVPPAPMTRAPLVPPPPAPRSEHARDAHDETPDQAFAAALKTFRRREHGQAVLEFMDFVARFPKHGLTPRAQYWIGEAYYVQRDYPQALLEFKRVLEMDPGALAASDALLRIGMCHANLRQPGPAAAAWQRIVREYPRTEAAGKARSFLAAAAAAR